MFNIVFYTSYTCLGNKLYFLGYKTCLSFTRLQGFFFYSNRRRSSLLWLMLLLDIWTTLPTGVPLPFPETISSALTILRTNYNFARLINLFSAQIWQFPGGKRSTIISLQWKEQIRRDKKPFPTTINFKSHQAFFLYKNRLTPINAMAKFTNLKALKARIDFGQQVPVELLVRAQNKSQKWRSIERLDAPSICKCKCIRN